MAPAVPRGLFRAAEDPLGDALDEGLEGGEARAGDADAEFHAGPDEGTDVGP